MTGFTIGYDRDGNPELLADSRSTYEHQQKRMALLKAGHTAAPEGVFRIELWNSETGISMRWQDTAPAPVKSTKEPTKGKTK